MIDDDSKRAQILSYEYNALRAEVVSRYAAQFRAGSLALGILVPVVGFAFQTQRLFAGAVLFFVDIICACAVIAWIDFDLKKISARLKVLEAEINDLAGGPPLLKWEAEHGIGGVFAKRISR
jgi:hypothetical protein